MPGAMEVLLLTRSTGHSQISFRRGGPIARFATRMHAWRLDIALARGASPDSAAALSLRAHYLIAYETRRLLASEIERLLRDVRRPVAMRLMCLAPRRDQVLAAESELLDLAARLAGAAPVEAAGVARARLLLRDGAGPLYSRAREGELERLVEAALTALEPHLPDDEDQDWQSWSLGQA